MSALREAFDERLEEVNAYLKFLTVMEAQTQAGKPRFAGSEDIITPQQQKLLYASVYLQLYSLVEATITLCMGAVADAAASDEQWVPGDLAEPLRVEWVRSLARTHIPLNYENRLREVVTVVDRLLRSLPVDAFEIHKGGGGNWDDKAIEKMSVRLGCALNISAAVTTSVKRRVKDDYGPLGLVKSVRNRLAHGEMSFTESADQVTVAELNTLAEAVVAYLGEVVDRFVLYVDDHEYLVPERRSTVARP
jgi:MAE_28990/MAE_18760-like HEPN